MQDNGLLKFYRYRAYREGFLDTKQLRLKEESSSMFDSAVRCKSPTGSFYKKFRYYFPKDMADAEILLSQVFSKAGLNSAIYIPAEDGKNKFLLCNDLTGENTIRARDFHEIIAEQTKIETASVTSFMAQPYSTGADIVKYFSQKALTQKVKTRILDSATFNSDRQDCNYFYTVNAQGVADEVVLFDYERSGIESTNCIARGQEVYVSYGYPNDFGEVLTRKGVVDEIKRNEFVASSVSLPQIAEEIGSVNVPEIALDISRTTGYVVEPRYVDLISKSMNETAEMLMK